MACTTFNCPSCGNGYSGACCPTCQPAQSIYQGECQDPGTITVGRFLSVRDYKQCDRRLATGAGFLVSTINTSGNAGITWTTAPQVQLGEVDAAENTAFGQMIVMGADYRWRALNASAAPNLFLQTNGTGDLILAAGPEAVVPDPLSINNLSVAVAATIAALTTTSTVTFNNTPAGTPVNLLGLNASNELVTQNIASSIAMTMFYEEPSSPSANAPNKNATNGSYLIIGNKLYDSGSNLINVTTSQALTVAVAGKYLIDFEGLCRMTPSTKAAISLEINGVIVNTGNGRTDAQITATGSNTSQVAPFVGFEARNLAVGDVIKLQLSSSGSITTYNVRLRATKIADV